MNHQRVAALFDQALDVAGEERAAWIERACAGDAELRAELERLLRADQRAANFLERPPALVADAAAAAQAVAPAESAPRQFGAWRVLRRIGSGGMGEVWLGERSDGQFEQRGAIKQLAYPTPGLLQRFRQERQILARLEHPDIARLIDGGVDADGAPYLVMEYVEGVPITQYARDRALDLRARLQLFLRVCGAVQYAHQNLIVHRDLKPANIFVTAQGAPKLLDFGIAKVLATTEEAAQTQTAARLLTPDYAAPEQFSGAAITTATDVYALGVVLYELLAEVRPRRSAPMDASTAATTTEPLPPSAAIDRTTGAVRRRALRGDLDRITLTALAADPQRRYPSAEALGADIRRYLEGRPISARRDSAWYRLRKFAKRNRYALAAAVAVVAVSVAAAIISLHQAHLAREQATRAEEQAARAQAVRKFLVGVFEQAKPDENKGQPITAQQLLRIGEGQLAVGVGDPPAIRADLTGLIGTLYWDIGDYARAQPLLQEAVAQSADPRVTDEIRARNLLGLATTESEKQVFDAAYNHAQQALALARQAGSAGVGEMSDAHRLIANILFLRGDSKLAEPLLRQLLVDDRANSGTSPAVVADDLQLLGSVLGELTRYDESETAFRDAIKIDSSSHGDRNSKISGSYNELGQMLLHKGDLAAAENALRIALNGVRQLYGPESQPAWTVQSNLLHVLEMKGQFEEVLPQRLRMLEQENKAQIETRPESLAFHTNLVGVDYRELGQLDKAAAAFREALAIWAMIQGSSTQTNSANPLFNLGITLELQGRYAQAQTSLRAALAIQQKHELPSSQWLNATRGELGNLLRLQHQFPEAWRELREAVAALAAATENSGSESNPILATLQARLAEAELDAGNLAEAHATAIGALALARKALPAGNFRLGPPLFALARVELAMASAGEAESLLHEALALRSAVHPANDPRILEVKVALVNALTTQKKTDEARKLTAEIEPLLLASITPYAADLRERLAKK